MSKVPKCLLGGLSGGPIHSTRESLIPQSVRASFLILEEEIVSRS